MLLKTSVSRELEFYNVSRCAACRPPASRARAFSRTLRVYYRRISHELSRRYIADASVCLLLKEYFCNPLSLLQLSRDVICRLIGMKDFERRVQPLPLSPLLLENVWRANETLSEVAPRNKNKKE